jgi:hypothetical protein
MVPGTFGNEVCKDVLGEFGESFWGVHLFYSNFFSAKNATANVFKLVKKLQKSQNETTRISNKGGGRFK